MNRFPRMSEHSGHAFGRSRFLVSAVWIAFILVPIVTAIGNRGSEPGHLLTIAGALLFTVVYFWLVIIAFDERGERLRYLLVATMLVLAIVLTLADRAGWGFLFTYVAACIGIVLPSRLGLPAVMGCALIAVGCSLIDGQAGQAIGWGSSAVGVGLLLVLLRDLRVRNQQLGEARAELATVAVARERERFARDLHDLLGHSLSVIAIKAELAGRLLPSEPSRAAREVSDLEQVARQALAEVRQAVSGYRQPTLDDELEGARMALTAAGIEAEVRRPAVMLDPDVEAVLAWAVREGATNVIRHSGARHCRVTVRAGLGDAEVEVVDDGGPAVIEAAQGPTRDGGGHGIAGLAERAERVRGRLEAGRLDSGGGFRLAVTVPRTADG